MKDKKTLAKPAKAPKRPQLNKMGPGKGFYNARVAYPNPNGGYTYGTILLSTREADKANAEDAYRTNKSIAAYRASLKPSTRRGGK
jgi:hypothetical protein